MSRPPIHPGEILADELAEIGISPAELARQLKVDPARLSRILNGKQGITGDTALRLAHWFGTDALSWLNLQAAYELRLAEQQAGAEIHGLPTRENAPPPPAQPTLL